MKEYIVALLFLWLITMIRYKYLIPELISENPLLVYAFSTFIIANILTVVYFGIGKVIDFIIDRLK